MKLNLPSNQEALAKVRKRAVPPTKRHKDKANDYKRQPKHKGAEEI